MLVGRHAERARLEGLLENAREGRSGVLVVTERQAWQDGPPGRRRGGCGRYAGGTGGRCRIGGLDAVWHVVRCLSAVPGIDRRASRPPAEGARRRARDGPGRGGRSIRDRRGDAEPASSGRTRYATAAGDRRRAVAGRRLGGVPGVRVSPARHRRRRRPDRIATGRAGRVRHDRVPRARGRPPEPRRCGSTRHLPTTGLARAGGADRQGGRREPAGRARAGRFGHQRPRRVGADPTHVERTFAARVEELPNRRGRRSSSPPSTTSG